MFLLDTNIISETRKCRPDPRVIAWIDTVPSSAKFTTVLTIGELRRGVEQLRRRDPSQADARDGWLGDVIEAFGKRILAIDRDVAERWGQLGVPDPVPEVDGLIAASALVHGLTVATRNIGHFARRGVATVNPFDG